jgi:hypothetical protein
MMPITGESSAPGFSLANSAAFWPAVFACAIWRTTAPWCGIQQRRMRQRVDAAGQHQLRATGVDVGDGRVERLHAGGAVAHHRPARHLEAAAHAQRGDAADVHLVRRGRGAAEDDFVEFLGGEGLAHQQRAARAVARSPAEKGPGALRALRKGVRAPSMM